MVRSKSDLCHITMSPCHMNHMWHDHMIDLLSGIRCLVDVCKYAPTVLGAGVTTGWSAAPGLCSFI